MKMKLMGYFEIASYIVRILQTVLDRIMENDFCFGSIKKTKESLYTSPRRLF
jgi:hypothetical protein